MNNRPARILLVFACAIDCAAQRNPVLAGDYPDPSVIRVRDEYWATATTSQWAPIFPLLRSKDLVHWRMEGAVFAKRPDWSETNYWAPEIAQRNGRFFIYYTAKKRGGPLCVAVATAARPQGPYTDHGPLVCQEVGSIDGMMIDDENGRPYLIWKEDGNSRQRPTPLWAQPLSDDGAKLTGEPRELFRNDAEWEGQLVEGPFLLRRDGWFYMFYSGAGCCGVKCNYALGVARARNLLGPWEKYAGNPILKDNRHWRCPGHGSIVDDRRGRTYLLYHAYDPRESVFVGRQGLLDEVTWGADGWPAINAGAGPGNGGSPSRARRYTAGFNDSGRLPIALQWPAAQEAAFEVRDGLLHVPAGAVIAKPPASMDYVATTRLELSQALAGISAYGNGDNAIGLAAAEGRAVLWRRRGGKYEEIARQPLAATAVTLRMTADAGGKFSFALSQDGRRWTDVSPALEGDYLPPWDLAPRIALTAEGATARFDWFRVVER